MKRYARIIFNGLTVLSLALCVMTVPYWLLNDYELRAHSNDDKILAMKFDASTRTRRVLYLNEGHICFACFDSIPQYYEISGRQKGEYYFLGIAWTSRAEPPRHHFLLTVHYGVVIALTGCLPLLKLITWIRRRNERPMGHCRRCGYDLRATPARCPECGTIPEKAKA